MKKAVVVVIVVGMFCGFWFFQARQIQKAVQAQFPSLTYDAVERSGFPLGLQLTFVNPQYQSADLAASINGNLRSNWSLLGSLKEVTTDGTIKVDSPYRFEVTGDSRVVLDDLSGNKGGVYFKNPKFDFTAYGVTNCYSAEALAVQYALDPQHDDRCKLVLDVSSKGVRQDLIQITDSPKQDIAFALECDIPSIVTIQRIQANPMAAFVNRLPSCSITLKSLTDTSNLHSSDCNGILTIQEDDENNVALSISGAFNTQVFEGAYEACLATIDQLKEVANNGSFDDAKAKELQTLVESQDLIKLLLPKFEKFGKIRVANQMRLVMNKQTMNWNVFIDDLGFSSDLYSARLKFYSETDGPTPRLDATLTLKNADLLIEDGVDFYNRLTEFQAFLDPKKPLEPIDPSKTKAIYAILKNVATVHADNTMQIAFECKDNEMSIGNKTLGRAVTDALALWENVRDDGVLDECQARVCQ